MIQANVCMSQNMDVRSMLRAENSALGRLPHIPWSRQDKSAGICFMDFVVFRHHLLLCGMLALTSGQSQSACYIGSALPAAQGSLTCSCFCGLTYTIAIVPSAQIAWPYLLRCSPLGLGHFWGRCVHPASFSSSPYVRQLVQLGMFVEDVPAASAEH